MYVFILLFTVNERNVGKLKEIGIRIKRFMLFIDRLDPLLLFPGSAIIGLVYHVQSSSSRRRAAKS